MTGFGVLGPLRATRDGVELALPGRRHRAVLARLLVARGAVVPVDRIIDDLWGGEQPAQAIAAIQTFVARLRRVIEPDRAPRQPATVLVTAPPGYALRARFVDAWRFEQLVNEAADLPVGTAEARWDEALALWQGPAFGEFADEHWARAEAELLEELRLHAVEQRAGVRLRTGRAAETAVELQGHVDAWPLREQAWALLAQAQYVAGRPADAMATLGRARTVLDEELGVPPGPELRQVEANILARAEQLRPLTPAAPIRLATTGPRDTFLGRDAELSRLLDVAASGGLALVTGEPGAGKSRLLAELAGQLVDRGWLVGRGRCPQVAGGPPGWPWAEIVRDIAGVRPPADPAAIGWLLDDDATAPADRHRGHRAIRDFLASTDLPLALLLDDLHWADEETLAILRTALTGVSDRTIVVLAYRHVEVEEPLAETLAGLATQLPVRIELGGLPLSAVAAILSADVPDDVVATIARRTGGNPFFVHETARLLATDGIETAVSVVPAGVADVLRWRLGRLPAPARTVLTQATVLGSSIDLDTLIELTGQPEDAVLDAVEAALMLGLLTETAGDIAFPHALVRDTLYTSMSPPRRSRLHARAGFAIERTRPEDVGALAYQFDAAGDAKLSQKVCRYAQLAAAAAESRYGYHEAANLWQRALTAFDGPAAERLDLLLSRVRTLALAGEVGLARALRTQTLEVAEALGDPLLTAKAIAAFDVPTMWSTRTYGELDTHVISLNERTMPLLPPGDSAIRCQLLVNLALELEGSDDPRGPAMADDAVEMADRLGDPQLRMMALNSAVMQSWWVGALESRTAYASQLLELAIRHDLVVAEQVGRMALATAQTARGEFGQADQHVDVVEQIAKEYDQRLALAITGGYRGQRLMAAGEPELARAAYRTAARHVHRIQSWLDQGTANIATISVGFLSLGRLGQVVDMWNAQDFANFTELWALALATAGRHVEAVAAAVDSPPIPRDNFWDLYWAVRGLLGVALDDHERISAAYEQLLPYEDLVAAGITAILVLGPIASVLGAMAAAQGNLPAAAAHYRHAIVVARRCGASHWERAAADALAQLSDQ